jgi:UDP-glucuronate 4-epimerase
MNRVLLTGGAGFIGSHVAEGLLRKGWGVAVIDNFDPFYPESWKRRNLAEAQESGTMTVFECDICDRKALADVFAQCDPSVVIHLAARAGVRPSIEQPSLYEQVNIAGTYNLLEVCRNREIAAFVFGSSSSVYGESTRAPFREDECSLRPISPYAATKLAGELVCYTYSHLYGLNVACLRFFTVYGPRQRPDLAIHKFTGLIESAKEVPVFGDGTTGRDYTYVDDIVGGVYSATDWCLDGRKGEGRYEIFNLGNSNPIRLNDLIGAIERATGKTARRKQFPPQAGDVSLTWADISRAGKILGYEPQTRLEAGLSRFVEWYRRQPQDLRA